MEKNMKHPHEVVTDTQIISNHCPDETVLPGILVIIIFYFFDDRLERSEDCLMKHPVHKPGANENDEYTQTPFLLLRGSPKHLRPRFMAVVPPPRFPLHPTPPRVKRPDNRFLPHIFDIAPPARIAAAANDPLMPASPPPPCVCV